MLGEKERRSLSDRNGSGGPTHRRGETWRKQGRDSVRVEMVGDGVITTDARRKVTESGYYL